MTPTQTRDNPFPIEAVATYGDALRTCEDLAFMQACKDQLNEYVIKYEKAEARYGCAIGLRGAHGSGKTHLLSWIGQQAAAGTVNKPTVLYAKADRASFFDLYTQFVDQLKPRDLQLTITEAVKNLAVEEVNKAEVTKSIEGRLQTPRELQRLFFEENLDREALFLTLRDRLQVSGAPQEITEVLLLVESPTLGEKAHNWLSGKRVEDPEALGVSYQLEALPVAGETTSIPDVVAVNAMETVAALFAVARRPLLILVDQLEVLLRTDAERLQTLSSVIKKLIEQLGRQNVLIFIAGTPEPWSRLPRDVAPRLRTREPLPVGVLSADEARLLLGAFSTRQFKSATLAALMRITGGNLREILRISHHAFAKFGGNLENATSDDLIECANLAGTLEDRRKLALTEVDQALAALGTPLADVDVGGEMPVDRLVQTPSAPAIAVVMLKAADRVSEARLARSLLSATLKLNERWPDARVLIVTVGYSTETIREQLGRTATVIEYAEGTFSRVLQGILADTIREGDARKTSADAISATDLRRLADSIEARLNDIEARRSKETERIIENFISKTRVLAGQERERRELKTRWDILAELDKLLEAGDQGPYAGRESMRAVLVANEVNIKNVRLGFLGSMYLDCIMPAYYDETARFRSDLIVEMRRVLQPGTASSLLFDHPWRAIGILSGACVVFLLLFLQIFPWFSTSSESRGVVRIAVLTVMTVLTYAGFLIPFWASRWRSRWKRYFEQVTRGGESSSIRLP